MGQRLGGRAQSTVIGVVLLLGITVASVTVIVTVGSDSLDATSSQMELSSAEHAMMELDSKITLVAHGGSSTQEVHLPQDRGSSVRVEETAGWLNISIVNGTSGEVESVVTNQTMGALVYENGETEVAYQNGGVWRYRNGGSLMVSPPEAHYRGTTLTLPMIRVKGPGGVGGNPVVKQTDVTTGIYPTESLVNPLTGGQVNLRVHSRYYRAWGDYFEQRTAGEVSFDHSTNTVTLELVVPFEGEFANALGTSSPGGISTTAGDEPTPYEEGVSYPLPDSHIESMVDDCRNGSCEDADFGTELTAEGPYYHDGDLSEDFTVDTTNGNVTLVVNGGINKAINVSTEGDGRTTLLLREGVSGGGEFNAPGDPENFKMMVHSDGDISANGGLTLHGLLYAPGSDCDLNGAPNVDIKGGIICDTAKINGKNADFEYDESIIDTDLGLDSGNIAQITYLHVSRTNVTVSE